MRALIDLVLTLNKTKYQYLGASGIAQKNLAARAGRPLISAKDLFMIRSLVR